MSRTAERIKPPSLHLAYSELHRALIELASLPLAAPILRNAPEGDGHPVLVLPGFTAGDDSTVILRRYLDELGYDTYGWELGRNLGPKTIGAAGEHLAERIVDIHGRRGRKISLIGQSLGGVMAREASRHIPEMVRQVISLGSPFTGNPRASNVWKLYERLSGQRISDIEAERELARMAVAPPVPSTAIYSRTDGIVAWQNCIELPAETTDNIEVLASHCGMAVHPATLYAVADRLAQPEGQWRRFERSGLRRAFYPSSGHRAH